MATYEIFNAQNGSPTVRIIQGNAPEVTLHSIVDPEKAAERLAQSHSLPPDDLLIVLGHGLGYFSRALLARFPMAVLCVIEPNRRLLDKALELFPGDRSRMLFPPHHHPVKIAQWLASREPDRRISFLLLPGCDRLYGLYFHKVQCTVELSALWRVRTVNLDLGAGSRGMKNHIHCDARPFPDVELVCRIDRVPLDDDVADAVFSSHAIEHFPHGLVPDVLREWRRLLKPGGRLTIWCPNLGFLCLRYAEGVYQNNMPGFVRVIYGGQEYEENYHQSGFDFPLLRQLLTDAGFSRVEEDFQQDDVTETLTRDGKKYQYRLIAHAWK